MRNTIAIAIILGTTAMSAPVAAGGLAQATTEPEMMPPMAAPVTWSGAYVGGFLGAGNYAGSGQDLDGDATDQDGLILRMNDFSGEAGVLLGYNLQRGNLVYGAEIDFAAMNFSDEEILDDQRQEAATDSMISLRGRIGLAVNDTFIFGTAGVARASVTGCISDDSDSCEPVDVEIATFDGDINGIVFGACVEHMVTDKLSVRVEYLQFEGGWSDKVTYDESEEERAQFSADSKAVRVGISYNF